MGVQVVAMAMAHHMPQEALQCLATPKLLLLGSQPEQKEAHEITDLAVRGLIVVAEMVAVAVVRVAG